MARSLALDENNQPILVEYNEQGEEVQTVSIPAEYAMDVAKLKVITAFEYRHEKARLDKFEELHKNDLWKDAEIMSLDKFKGTEFVAADGKTRIAVPTLPSYVKSVLVRGRSARINADPNELVLLSFSVDLSEDKAIPEQGSLLINDKGQVIYTSSNNIAPRVGFFGDPNEKQEFYSGLRKPEDRIFGPVKYTKVYISPEAYPGSMTSSDFRGKYSMSFMLPYCPGGFEYTTDVWAELRYANFSPYGSPTIPYYLRRQDWTYCYDLPPFSGGPSLGAAMDYVNAMAVVATRSIPVYNIDFKVDVMFLSGRIILKNPDGSPITVGGDTQYHVTPADNTSVAQAFYDFDGDGKADRSVVGDIRDEVAPDGTVKKVFFQQQNGAHQGVYFSSQTKPDGTPNVIRLADKGDRQKSNGLLKSISKEDFKNTDIYVFRESTGQLVVERNGLKDEEIASRVDNGLGKGDQFYFYRLMLRGPMDNHLNVGAINRSKNWEEWAEQYRLAEPFRKRESDYLKSGEWVRLVVINRATGYMGTQRIQLGDASKNAGSMLSVKLDDTVLQPPNLRIWAERDYTQSSGLDQGKALKNNIIGMEGASLDSDDIIRVYTQWLDEEGRPLPEGLGADNGEQYGLTGRLAKVGAPNQLVEVAAGSLASFPIAPGLNTQVLRLKDNLTAPEHFYVHVAGMQKDESPDFGTDPTEAPPLDTRPKNATPFLVPIYDENKHWKTWSAWNQLKRAYDAEELDQEPLKPKGSYVWHLRPEYQFSQLALEVQKIERQYTTESGETKTQELLVEQKDEGKIPTIRANDDLVRVFYSLIGNSNNPLMPIDGEQELVFGFGASEVRATLGKNGEIVFKDLAHIDSLDPVDLLTLRLYVNHDAGNTLWEWAFTRNGLHVFYEVPGNTQEKSKRALADIADTHCKAINHKQICTDIEILALLADEDKRPAVTPAQQPAPMVRTLGGMRLRLRYIQPNLDGLKVTKVTWTMGHKGRYCKEYGVSTATCNVVNANVSYEQTHPYTPALPTQTEDWSIYWEPVAGDNKNSTDWSNWAGTKTDDKGVASSLKAQYTIPANSAGTGDTPTSKLLTRTFEQEFTFNTRELKPATGTEKPMQGSDVAMLEAMLWQLGISPQYGFPGYVGSRIDAISPASLKKSRSEYSAGWADNYKLASKDKKGIDIPENITAKKTASIEMMVRRFKGRSFSITDVAGANQTGNVDTDTLAQLGKVWSHYYSAYIDEPQNPYTTDSVPSTWWDGLANLLTTGGNIPYQKVSTSYRLSALDPNLNAIAAHFPVGASGIQLAGFLRAWSDQESGGKIRGTGDPVTAYRTHEGGGDNEGSMGFNHVLWKRMYGKENSCKTNRGYADGKHNINLYLPFNSLQAFLAAAADKDCSTSAGLYKAYSGGNSYSVEIAAADKPFKYCYETTGRGTNAAEKRCSREENRTNWHVFNDSHDAGFNLLGKAVMAYNHGTGDLNARSYFSSTNTGLKGTPNANGTNFDYWLRVKEKTYQMRTSIGGYLPLVSYIWKGGKYPKYELDENGEIKKDGNNQPILHPRSEQDWCFVYGEKDWINPDQFITEQGTKIKGTFKNYKDRATDDENYTFSCE